MIFTWLLCLNHTQMNYPETIQYLYNRLPVFHQIGAKAYKPGLENSFKMMNLLGNPQNQYKTIHIAGTNGKGSVSHFLTAILMASGYKIGLYTSPHLVDFRERIRVNGEKISEQYVVNFVKDNKAFFDKIQPSFFETTMAMAFQYFADSDVDIAVIEVGLGGRLDSTNIISPILSVITNIGFDHTEFLGDTPQKIASEKAGIIKPKTPVVVGETASETNSIFIEKAALENAPVIFSQKTHTVKYDGDDNGFLHVESSKYGKLKIGLNGDYQLKNVATVLACTDELNKVGVKISSQSIRLGLEKVVELTGLQGRWQEIQKKPRVIADIGHNVEGVKIVAAQLRKQRYNRLHVVFGMVNDKDVSGVLALLPQEAKYYFTAAQTKRALSPKELQEKAKKYNLEGKTFPTVDEAVRNALNTADKNDLIFIGGSNFIVGEALAFFNK